MGYSSVCFRLWGIIKEHSPEGKRCPPVMDHRKQRKCVEGVTSQKGPDRAADSRGSVGSATGELDTGLLKA